MTDFSVMIIENGFPHSLPGFLDDTAVSSFPFWGNFIFFDFSIVNFLNEQYSSIHVVINKKYRKIIPLLTSRWKNEIRNILVPENDKEDILSYIKQVQSRGLIISFLPLIVFFDSENLIDLIGKHENKTLKLCINKTPVDIYYIKKKLLIEYFESLAEEDFKKEGIFDIILKGLFTHKVDLMINIPGNVFFTDKIMQLYQGNLWLIRNLNNKIFLDLIFKLSGKIPEGKGSFISEYGYIRNSIISQGVEINGYVENSIIFPHVIIKKKANVVNSVIMNNNIIGTDTYVQNTIILPFNEENPSNMHNIGDNSKIGGKTSIMRNRDFPDQIFNGLTVLGINTLIPRGFRIEQSSYLGPHISLKELKQLKILKKGVSLYK